MNAVERLVQIQEEEHELVTGFKASIDTDHAYIHQGLAFVYSNKTTSLAADATYGIVVRTPVNRFIHYRPMLLATTANLLEVKLAEGSTYTGGTPVTPFCKNRQSERISQVSMSVAATVTEGTVLDYFVAGSAGLGGNRQGGNLFASDETILKRDTTYSFLFTNVGAVTATVGYYRFFWYEEERG